LVQVYGEPADVFHLKNKMKEALNTNSAPAAFSHNVLDLQTMTENTVKAYGKTRGH
jgi:hypothetical protein